MTLLDVIARVRTCLDTRLYIWYSYGMDAAPFTLLLTAEFRDAHNAEDARRALDAFREAVLPSDIYGITLFEADGADATR